MRGSIPAAIALLMLGLTISSTAALFFRNGSPADRAQGQLNNSSPSDRAQGQLRCEGAGAVVINIDGADYAVNGMASRRYPPIQRIWNSASHPEADIDHIIVQGLTLCDWGSKSLSTSSLKASATN
jgi:hypothetical protein